MHQREILKRNWQRIIWLKTRENSEGSKRKRCITYKRSATKITADISKTKSLWKSDKIGATF